MMVIAFEAGEPGFVATNDAVPAAARSAAGMATVTWVASTIVVVRYAPFQVTAVPGAKFEPVKVSNAFPEPTARVVDEAEPSEAALVPEAIRLGTMTAPRNR